MKYFTIQELCASDTARKKGIDNTAPGDVKVRLSTLAEKILDPLRERYGKPIRVNSGYRSPILNKAVGGTPTSQHLRGEAADITGGTVEENRKLLALLSDMEFDQLIDESNLTWIHVSYRAGNNRREFLKL
ncbi:D-Ala-D-Ala carboxypeptidase family metallohydrolase [Barnesiella propionica]|uniref:D-Ala-D-Ala carboxypeptidase family metallohydrolase n=1 Tax=Barnesiella propionica TaxID=2981781 RepID=UPI0011C9F365|nr:D-Ala-D-Ala carboxypeptidase family metallohydrolase [Barnesiella propionica]MCU6769302.1 D-Ala-D-Ala carboxypeptidase family metallohydrolase [Barnesiella propionica]